MVSLRNKPIRTGWLALWLMTAVGPGVVFGDEAKEEGGQLSAGPAVVVPLGNALEGSTYPSMAVSGSYWIRNVVFDLRVLLFPPVPTLPYYNDGTLSIGYRHALGTESAAQLLVGGTYFELDPCFLCTLEAKEKTRGIDAAITLAFDFMASNSTTWGPAVFVNIGDQTTRIGSGLRLSFGY